LNLQIYGLYGRLKTELVNFMLTIIPITLFCKAKLPSLEYLLFVLYLVLFSWLITRIKFFTRTELSNSQLIILFLLKIIAGIFYGWIGTFYGGLAKMYDTWSYHFGSVEEYKLLFSDPQEYLTNLFYSGYDGGNGGLFSGINSYWNDLKANVFIKILSVFNIFTFGNYYVNVIFYSFVTLVGPIALYRIMADIFPGKKIIVLLSCFFIPSFLFWTSGLGKEGLIFTATALIIYCFYFSVKDEGRWTIKRILVVLFSLILLLALRNFVFILISAGLLVWLMSVLARQYRFRFFVIAYLGLCIFFFTAKYISPGLNFPAAVVNKQDEFNKLVGGESTIPTTALKPTAKSFILNTPEAFSLSSLRPYPGDVKHLLSLAASLEINLILLIIVLFLFFRVKTQVKKPALYFLIFYSVSILLSIGFSVNNLGAIVRYRSIILPLIIVPVIAQIDWKRFFIFSKRLLRIEKKMTIL
jgi:hypothetical protein